MMQKYFQFLFSDSLPEVEAAFIQTANAGATSAMLRAVGFACVLDWPCYDPVLPEAAVRVGPVLGEAGIGAHAPVLLCAFRRRPPADAAALIADWFKVRATRFLDAAQVLTQDRFNVMRMNLDPPGASL